MVVPGLQGLVYNWRGRQRWYPAVEGQEAEGAGVWAQTTGKNIDWVSEVGDGGCGRWVESNLLETLSPSVLLKMTQSLQAVLRARTIAVKGPAWLTGHR